jgi:hypothetical protein
VVVVLAALPVDDEARQEGRHQVAQLERKTILLKTFLLELTDKTYNDLDLKGI